MKLIINGCYGGFSLSPEAELRLFDRGVLEIASPVDKYFPIEGRKDSGVFGYKRAITEWRAYAEAKEKTPDERPPLMLTVFTPDEKFVLNARDISRDHPELVRVVEEMGSKANGCCADLKVIEVPDGVDWCIEEYDGMEWVAEKHRTWS